MKFRVLCSLTFLITYHINPSIASYPLVEMGVNKIGTVVIRGTQYSASQIKVNSGNLTKLRSEGCMHRRVVRQHLNMLKLVNSTPHLAVLKLFGDPVSRENLCLYEALRDSQKIDEDEASFEINLQKCHEEYKHKNDGYLSRKYFDAYKYCSRYPLLILMPEYDFKHYSARIESVIKDLSLPYSMIFTGCPTSRVRPYPVSREQNGSDAILQAPVPPSRFVIFNRNQEKMFAGFFEYSSYKIPGTDLLVPLFWDRIVRGSEFHVYSFPVLEHFDNESGPFKSEKGSIHGKSEFRLANLTGAIHRALQNARPVWSIRYGTKLGQFESLSFPLDTKEGSLRRPHSKQ